MNKQEFKQNAHKVLDELIEYIDKLESKATDIAEDAKDEYNQQLANLKEIKQNLSDKLGEYDTIADSKWDVVKSSAAAFVDSVSRSWKVNYTKVSEALKKDKKASGNTSDDVQ